MDVSVAAEAAPQENRGRTIIGLLISGFMLGLTSALAVAAIGLGWWLFLVPAAALIVWLIFRRSGGWRYLYLILLIGSFAFAFGGTAQVLGLNLQVGLPKLALPVFEPQPTERPKDDPPCSVPWATWEFTAGEMIPLTGEPVAIIFRQWYVWRPTGTLPYQIGGLPAPDDVVEVRQYASYCNIFDEPVLEGFERREIGEFEKYFLTPIPLDQYRGSDS